MTENEKLAYIAGFLDADGSITISYGRKTTSGFVYVPVVCFYNTDIKTLLWIQKVVGGNIYNKPRKSEKHTPSSQLNLRNRTEMYTILPKLIPYLIRKKKQAKLLYKYLDSRTKRGWKNHRHLPATDKETIYLKKIRDLNKSQCTHAKMLSELPARHTA